MLFKQSCQVIKFDRCREHDCSCNAKVCLTRQVNEKNAQTAREHDIKRLQICVSQCFMTGGL